MRTLTIILLLAAGLLARGQTNLTPEALQKENERIRAQWQTNIDAAQARAVAREANLGTNFTPRHNPPPPGFVQVITPDGSAVVVNVTNKYPRGALEHLKLGFNGWIFTNVPASNILSDLEYQKWQVEQDQRRRAEHARTNTNPIISTNSPPPRPGK